MTHILYADDRNNENFVYGALEAASEFINSYTGFETLMVRPNTTYNTYVEGDCYIRSQLPIHDIATSGLKVNGKTVLTTNRTEISDHLIELASAVNSKSGDEVSIRGEIGWGHTVTRTYNGWPAAQVNPSVTKVAAPAKPHDFYVGTVVMIGNEIIGVEIDTSNNLILRRGLMGTTPAVFQPNVPIVFLYAPADLQAACKSIARRILFASRGASRGDSEQGMGGLHQGVRIILDKYKRRDF